MELTLEQFNEHLFMLEQFCPLEVKSKVVDLNIVYYGNYISDNPLLISNCYTYGCQDDSSLLIGYLISLFTKLETHSGYSPNINDFNWTLNVITGTYFFTIKVVINNKEYTITELGNRISHILLKAYVLYFQLKKHLKV
jgi:hypothetical protein